MTQHRPNDRRGIAVVVMVLLLLIVDLIIIGMVLGGARDQDLSLRRLETVQSFYATEGAMNMAIREMMLGRDEDGDAGIGTVSDDADDGTDPSFGTGQSALTKSISGFERTLDGQGRSGESRRRAETLLD